MQNKPRAHRLTPLAEADLEEIWLAEFRKWSPDQADMHHKITMATIEDLALGRKVGQRCNVREGYWKYKAAMRVIYFRCSDDYLDVIRILNGNMDFSSASV